MHSTTHTIVLTHPNLFPDSLLNLSYLIVLVSFENTGLDCGKLWFRVSTLNFKKITAERSMCIHEALNRGFILCVAPPVIVLWWQVPMLSHCEPMSSMHASKEG